jgi:hypothetical protein
VVVGQRHIPTALLPGKRLGTYCIRGWVGPGPVWMGAENLALSGIRSPDRPVASRYTDCARWMRVGDQLHASAALPPGKSRYPLQRSLDMSQVRSGRVRKILPTPVFDPRTVQSVASRYTDGDIAALFAAAEPLKISVISVIYCHTQYFNFLLTKISLRTAWFNIQKFYKVLASRRVICKDLRTNSEVCFVHH